MSFSKAIVSTHVFVPKNEINLDSYRRRYTIKSKYSNGPVISYYKEDDYYFGIPRHAMRLTKAIADELDDRRILGSPVDIKFKGDLWDYQLKAIDEFSTLVAKGGSGFFLEAAPGSGKTVMGLKMLSLLGVTSLVIVPKSDLVKQWKDRIVKFTNIKEKEIGIVEGGSSNYKGKKIVIGLVHSVVIDRIATKEFCSYFGAILFDECDSSLPPKTFSSASGMFPAKYRIGMTASATRADGLHVIFEENLAQFRIKCSNTKTLEPTVILHMFKESSGEIPSYLKDLQRRGVLISNLASNPIRNNILANYASKSYNSGRATLIISDRKDQLKSLEKLLIKVYKIPSKDIGYFVRSLDGKNLKESEKRHSAESCQIILATYGMLSRGTDIPRLSCLILGTLRSDLRQTLGRIERFMEGKSSPVLVDLIDTHYKETMNSAKARIKFYKSRNLVIKEVRPRS
jgi:superfamily II DNA or RNA helicase